MLPNQGSVNAVEITISRSGWITNLYVQYEQDRGWINTFKNIDHVLSYAPMVTGTKGPKYTYCIRAA